MKLGILGGSFNPVHNGHLFLADKAISALNLDRVIFVPAYRSPFKLDAKGMESSGSDRLLMLAAAAAGDPRYAIEDCEIVRKGVSYTLNTLEDIIERYLPDGKPALIIGDDLAADFPKWHGSKRILELADIVIARRLSGGESDKKIEYPYPHIFIDNEVMDISSREVRQRISEGGSWRPLVPAEARAIIEEKRLYGYDRISAKGYSRTVIMRIEAEARGTLSAERFIHSKNTAIHASDMCRRFNLDPMAGYLAGIAHDLAKQMSNKQVLKIVKSDKMGISAIEKDKPNLLHGRAAAVLLKDRFCINNEDVLEAVALHTSGSGKMGPLAKVIYIADKTEPSRNIEPALRKMCKEADLDAVLYAVLDKTIEKLRAKGAELSEGTLQLLNKKKELKN